MAKQDSPWDGPEAVPAPREADPVADDDAPVADAPAAKPAVPRPVSPWHHSRPKRPVRPAARAGATAPGSTAALGLLRRLRLPQISPIPARAWAPWVGGALALAWLGTALHPVGPHEQAIVATFGASGPVLGPGLAVSWPWPIGSAHVTDVTTVRHMALPAGDREHLMLTADGSLIDLGDDVRWRLSDLRRHDLDLADPDAALRLAAETAMRATVAGMTGAAVFGPGHETVAQGAARRLQALLDRDQAGIVIDGIDIRRAEPPARVADALRGGAAARAVAANEATQARSWSQQLIVHAQGEAGAFDKVYAQYRLAPEVTRREMYYATMERVLGQSDKVIVDAPGTTMNLPLPALASAPAPTASESGGKVGNGH